MNLEEDLRRRWTPSPEQDRDAAAALRAGAPGVYTAHLMVDKQPWFWSDRVRVEALPGVFPDRDAVSALLTDAARIRHEQTGRPVCGGYTWHHVLSAEMDPQRTDDGRVWLTGWAVFEDYLVVYPRD